MTSVARFLLALAPILCCSFGIGYLIGNTRRKNTKADTIEEPCPEKFKHSVDGKLVSYYEQVVKEEYPEEDKPEGWPSWRAMAEEMERNWHGATETHIQERERADKLNRVLRGVRSALRRTLSYLPPDSEISHYCGEWLSEATEPEEEHK